MATMNYPARPLQGGPLGRNSKGIEPSFSSKERQVADAILQTNHQAFGPHKGLKLLEGCLDLVRLDAEKQDIGLLHNGGIGRDGYVDLLLNPGTAQLQLVGQSSGPLWPVVKKAYPFTSLGQTASKETTKGSRANNRDVHGKAAEVED